MKLKEYDVIVTGGGLAGCTAAISAARCGMSVLIIERFGYLGGWATAALVSPFMSHSTSDGTPLVAGIFDELCNKLTNLNGFFINTFDPEIMKFALQEMVLESGANIRLHTMVKGASFASNGDVIIEVYSKSGEETYTCKRLVDCSGDGDAAVMLGADFEIGNKDKPSQAVTLVFDVAGVDTDRALQYVKDNPDQMRFPKLAQDVNIEDIKKEVLSVAGYYDLVKIAKENGEYLAPGELIFYIGRPKDGEVTFNTTHIGNINGTDADDITYAEIETRRQMMSVVSFIKKYVPGFENSSLIRSGAHVGVRESRRIIGEYIFDTKDIIDAVKHPDAICRLAYYIDIHHGSGRGYTKAEEKDKTQNAPESDWYEIPYRCLLPKNIKNTLIAGRCVSSTQTGHSAIRIMPACIAMGQAAGTAAAISIKDNKQPKDIDFKILKMELLKQGALV